MASSTAAPTPEAIRSPSTKASWAAPTITWAVCGSSVLAASTAPPRDSCAASATGPATDAGAVKLW